MMRLSPAVLLLVAATSCSVRETCSAADPSCSLLPVLLYPRSEVRYLYVANLTGTFLNFRVSGSGSLSSLTPASFSSNLISPRNVALDPLLRYAYVTTSSGGANAQSYFLTRDTGVLTQATLTAQGGGLPWAITTDPLGRFVYVTDQSLNRVISYNAGPLSGTGLSAPATTAGPLSVAAEASGRFVYVGSSNAAIDRFNVSAGGVLTSQGSTPLTGGSQVSSLRLSSSSRFLYALNSTFNRIEPFTVNSDGTLTAMATITTGTAADFGVITPDDRYFYCILTAGNILQFAVNADGSLSPLSPASTSLASPTGMAMDPLGKFVYVTTATTITTFQVGSSGQLSQISQAVQGGLNMAGLTASGYTDLGAIR